MVFNHFAESSAHYEGPESAPSRHQSSIGRGTVASSHAPSSRRRHQPQQHLHWEKGDHIIGLPGTLIPSKNDLHLSIGKSWGDKDT